MSETHLAERLMYPLPDGWQRDPDHVAALKEIWPKVIAKNKELIDAEITSLRAQLEEARARAKLVEDAHEETAAKLHTYILLRAEQSKDVEEARAKAIEECLTLVDATAGYWRNDCAEGRSAICVTSVCDGISESIRALLSAPTEARTVLEASNKGGE